MASLENVTAELKRLNENQLKAGDLVEYVNAAGEVKEATFVKLLESTDRVGRRMLQLQAEQAMFAIGNDQVVEKESNEVEGILERIDDTLNKLIAFMGFQEKERERSTSATDFVGPPKPPEEQPGFIKGNFMKGFKDAEKNGLGLFEGPKKLISDILQTAGVIAATLAKAFAIFKTGLLFLGKGLMGMFSVITLPVLAIAALVVAITSAIFSFVEDFKGQEGSLFDKIMAGLLGFVDGFLKILTVPLDWIINLTAKVLDFFGMDGAAKVLENFSLTQLVDDFTDGMLEFLLKIKDGVVNFAANAWNSIKSFFGFGDDEEEGDTKRGMVIPGNEAGEGATGLKESDDYFKTERVETEGRIDGTAVLSGRSNNPDIADEGVTKADVMKYSDQGMAPREAIAAANAESRAEQDVQSNKRGMEIPRQGQTATSAPEPVSPPTATSAPEPVSPPTEKTPKKVTIPDGVRVTPFGSYASYNKFTNSQAQFDTVEEAVKFKDAPIEEAAKMDDYAAEIYNKRKQLDVQRQERVAKLRARRDAKEEESTSPAKTTVGTVAEALSPAVVNKGTEVLTEVGLDKQTAATITQTAVDAATTFVGGGEAVEQGGKLQLNQERLASAQAAASSASQMNVPIINAPNNNQTSVTNNTHVAAGMPATQDNSTRSHYRGRRI